MPTVTVSLLGPFEVTLDGRPVSVPRGRQRALLASLALHSGQAVSTETLVDRMWGEEPPRNPRNGLQVHVRRLRALLGDDVIRTSGGGYALDVAADDVDAIRFTRLVTRAGAADPVTAYRLLTEALDLWRGEPLTEIDSPTLERDFGAALVERQLLAVERRCDHDIAEGRPEACVAELRALTARHPLREPLWARLITALLDSGQAPEALDCYEQIREHLVDALGVDPGADLQRLHRRIVDVDRRGVGPFGARRVAPREVPHQLPPDPVGFAGRGSELAALNELLTSHRSAPVPLQTVCVVHGVGGVGKTALAVHWAHRVVDEFPDGQIYLDLHGYGPDAPLEPAGVIATVLQATGVPTDQLPAEATPLTALLRTHLAGRRMLILLDNVRDADQVRPLLPGAQSMVVVTSRSQLRGLTVRDGARQVTVGELGNDDARRLLAHSVAPARLAAEPQAAQRIVDLCSGLPLALRIVSDRASWHPDATLMRLAEGITDARGRVAGLSGGDDPASDLRAVFSWSYDKLPVETASTFRQLALYPATELSPVGVAALTARPTREVRRELDRLVSVHLVEPHARGRFRLHDLLREYAAELVADDCPESTAVAIRRVVDWCLHSVVNARAVIGDPLDGVELDAATQVEPMTFATAEDSIGWFDAERELLVGAVRAAAEHRLYRQGHQLAYLLRTLFHHRLRYEEFVAVAELGVTCARRLGDNLALARALRTLGNAYSWLERTDEAAAPLREAVELAESVGDVARQASAADNVAINYARSGEFAAALRYHRRAVDASRRLDDRGLLAGTLMNMGFTQITCGDVTDGVAATQEALKLFEDNVDDQSAALAHGNLADAYQRTDRPDLAGEHAERSLSVLRRSGNLDATAEVLVTLGRANQAKGELREAAVAWEEAAELVGADHWLSATVAELLAESSAPAG